MQSTYAEIPILHAFEAVLRDAFNESDKTDVQDWCDGLFLEELIGESLATEFYTRWPTETVTWWREDVDDSLGNQLNRDRRRPTVHVRKVGSQFLLYRDPEKGAGTWIDKS